MRTEDFDPPADSTHRSSRTSERQDLSLTSFTDPRYPDHRFGLPPPGNSDDLISRRILPRIDVNNDGLTNPNVVNRESDTRRPQFFVSPNGDDRNSGSADRPWRTIQKGAKSAIPGSVVNVLPGEYHGQVDVKVSGNEQAGYITFRSTVPGKAVLDLSSESRSQDDKSGFNIRNKKFVEVSGFEIKNLRASNAETTQNGVLVAGSSHVRLNGLDIHHIENNISRNSNAHGISIMGTGTSLETASRDIVVENNKLHDLKLGASEALVVNGNVDNFRVANNSLYRLNNIAIDVAGFEGVSKSAHDQPRNGSIHNNAISDVDSKGNPAYGRTRSAGGIYVDGGTRITIANNSVERANIGIELASEHRGKDTSSVHVTGNTLKYNTLAGIILGGASRTNGGSRDNVIENNILQHNDTDRTGTGEIGFQHSVRGVTVRNNSIITDHARVISGSTDGNVVADNQVRREQIQNHNRA